MNRLLPRRDSNPVTHRSAGRTLLFGVLAVLMSIGLMHDVAQSQTMMPLPAYGRTYTASQIRGYWFQAPTDFIITGLRVPTDVGTNPQYIEVVRFAATPPVYSASTSNYQVLGLFQNVNSTSVISTWIEINAGDYIGIFGTRSSNNSSHNNSYGTPETFYASNILGFPVTLTRMVYQGSAFPIGAVSQEVNAAVARTEMYYIAPITGPNDAGISSIDSPLNFCAGTHPVTVTLKNFGTNQLTSATIQWTINGTPQTPVNWTGMLDTTNPAARATSVTLGTQNFASNVSYTISAWATLPNGVADTVARNDTSTVTVKAAISGTYTIGGSGADYSDIQSAMDDASTNGICGAVVYKIRNGTYNEHVEIKSIPGASAINTVTIESESGSRGDVTITSAASGTTNNYAIYLNGCDFVTVRNVTLRTTSGTYATCARIDGGATYCTLENIDMFGSMTATTSTYARVIDSPADQDHHLTIRGCKTVGGSYGMYLRGSGTTSLMQNLIVENCEILEFAYMGIYAYYHDSPQYLNNTIRSSNTNYNYKYASYHYYNYNDLRYVGNTIDISGPLYMYGVLIYYSTGTSSRYGLVANNMMTFNNGNTYYGYGLRCGYGSNTKVMYNSIYVKSNSSYYAFYTYQGSNYEYYNNIAIYDGPGYAWYCYPGSNVSASDYNVLYSTNGNLAYWNSSAHSNLAALQTSSGMDMNSVSKIPEFENVDDADLHLAGASVDDGDMHGALMPEVTDDIDGDIRVVPYRGADEACYIERNSVTFEFVDANGSPTAYAVVPGQVGVKYHVAFPEFDANISITLRFYTVPGNVLTYTTSLNAVKAYGVVLDGWQLVQLTNLPTGTYRVEATFNTKNSCGAYQNYIPANRAFMAVPQGQLPCIVWPGDVNNDGLCNYGDRKGLTQYISDANLSPIWLNGPVRYRADMTWDPLTAIRWEPQAVAPWNTPEGCYMDTDGSGTINSFDFIAIKTNWMRSHDASSPKADEDLSTMTFGLSQNFPNPFNPTTQIQFSVPEPSHVRITVYDPTGREVATIHDGTAQTGIHSVTFDAQNLSSGMYTAVAEMQGETTGTTYSRAIQMNLSK